MHVTSFFPLIYTIIAFYLNPFRCRLSFVFHRFANTDISCKIKKLWKSKQFSSPVFIFHSFEFFHFFSFLCIDVGHWRKYEMALDHRETWKKIFKTPVCLCMRCVKCALSIRWVKKLSSERRCDSVCVCVWVWMCACSPIDLYCLQLKYRLIHIKCSSSSGKKNLEKWKEIWAEWVQCETKQPEKRAFWAIARKKERTKMIYIF